MSIIGENAKAVQNFISTFASRNDWLARHGFARYNAETGVLKFEFEDSGCNRIKTDSYYRDGHFHDTPVTIQDSRELFDDAKTIVKAINGIPGVSAHYQNEVGRSEGTHGSDPGCSEACVITIELNKQDLAGKFDDLTQKREKTFVADQAKGGNLLAATGHSAIYDSLPPLLPNTIDLSLLVTGKKQVAKRPQEQPSEKELARNTAIKALKSAAELLTLEERLAFSGEVNALLGAAADESKTPRAGRSNSKGRQQ